MSPLVLLGLVELVLRLAGYGFSTHFFLKDNVNGTAVLTDNARFGRWFFPPAQARVPTPFSIPAVKPPGTYRIFVLGESAAMGDPAPQFGFSRMIEVMLHARYPNTRFEVVNTAMTAINSHAILPIARDCARHDGDLWLIYMGNNEVVGPYGAGTVFGAESPPLPLIHASLALKSTRTGQWLDALRLRLTETDASRDSWGGMKMFLDHQVQADDPRMEKVYANFANNLEVILHAGMGRGVKQIVCTVGVNLKDCPPFASEHGANFVGAKQLDWERAYTNGVTDEAAGKFSSAIVAYAQADENDGDFAELQFRRGHCFLELGDYDQAARCFARARDLDTLRFRADGRINQIIQQQADGRTNGGIYFMDAAALLAANSPHDISGEEFFYEHVHLTFEGNYLMARAAAGKIAELLPETISRQSVTNDWLAASECAQRLGWNNWSHHQVLAEVHRRLLEPPFTEQIGHLERMAQLEQQLTELSTALKPDELQLAAQKFRLALVQAPDDAILHLEFAELLRDLGDRAGAIEQLEIVTLLLPHRADPYEKLGNLSYQTGRIADAEKYFRKSLALNPDSSEVLNGLGLVLAGQQKFSEAIGFYEQALQLRPPNSVMLRVNLALVLVNQEKTSEAIGQYREVLLLEPTNEIACINLGVLLLDQEKYAEAAAQFRRALQSYSRSPNAHVGLGVALEHQTNVIEAITNYQEALRLDPGNDDARKHLEQALGSPGVPAR